MTQTKPQIKIKPMHRYPCRNWLEEQSCMECRQIAEELAFLNPSEKRAYLMDLKEHQVHVEAEALCHAVELYVEGKPIKITQHGIKKAGMILVDIIRNHGGQI